jgi:hypothetical protein
VRPEWADGAPAVGAKVSVTTSGVQRRELWPDGGTSGPSELTADFGVQAGQVTVGVEFPDGEAVVIDGVVVDQLLRVRHP